jgi:hypothetical protein
VLVAVVKGNYKVIQVEEIYMALHIKTVNVKCALTIALSFVLRYHHVFARMPLGGVLS